MFRLMWKWPNKRRKMLAKRSGKSPFSEHLAYDLGFQSNGLEFSKCQILLSELVQLYGGRKSGGREAEFQERLKIRKE